jgi:hypothetical protein
MFGLEWIQMKKLTPEQRKVRFWSRVTILGPDDCWLWTGSTIRKGYGVFRTDAGGCPAAHRSAYEYAIGPIPIGMFVLHSCDVRACCNPQHLHIGTNADNMREMATRGRSAKGDRNGSRLYPWLVRRGEHHWTRHKPERLARGDRSSARLHPEIVRGSRNGNAKLNEDAVTEILSSDESGLVLAARFGVSPSAISLVRKGKSWTHVLKPDPCVLGGSENGC